MSVQFAVHHRFTVDEFQKMGEMGIFSPDDRVELIDGEIIEMTPVGSRHISCVMRLNRLFVGMLEGEAMVSPQSPIKTDEAQPVPDLAILRSREDEYEDTVPEPADCLLLIEVADSSVLFDRNVKSGLYARNEVPEYWIVDLTRNLVVVHRAPLTGEYTEVAEYGRDQAFTSPALGGREIRVQDLLGGR